MFPSLANDFSLDGSGNVSFTSWSRSLLNINTAPKMTLITPRMTASYLVLTLQQRASRV